VNAAVESRTFGVSTGELTAIDGWVEQVARRWGESERTVFRTRLCIAELAGNVIEHGGAPSGDDQIVVTMLRLGDGIGVEFLDTRPPFDPTGEREPPQATSLETLRPGGLGLRLVHAYARDLSYRQEGDRNRVSLKIESA
jgi:anti-sigma regulatory factor (Ser/Thr protein kinase)